MLKFDKTHKTIEGNIDKKEGAKSFKRITALGLAIIGLFLFSGCAKDVPCDIEGLHAHRYVSSENLSRYIVSEKDSVAWLARKDDYIEVTEQQSKLLDFANHEGLFNIEENEAAIDAIVKKNKYYVEYEYSYPSETFKYTYMIIDGEYHSVGRWEPTTEYDYTTYSKHSNLTGKRRLNYPVYTAYKIVQDENGSYKAIRSDEYTDYNDIPEEFTYVKKDFVRMYRTHHPYLIDQYIDEQVAKIAAEMGAKTN